MRKIFVLLSFLIAFFQFTGNINAAHLIGGELTYECVGGNNFIVRMAIYRDCNCINCADFFDDPASIYILDENKNVIENSSFPNPLQIDFNISTDEKDIIPDFSDLCAGTEPDLCVKQGLYEEEITLPPRAGGYYLVHQRCCRNNTISNIIEPAFTGATYEAFIPHDAGNCDNSSPVFNEFPPIVICGGYPLYFDHAATDLDGDSLVYELCTPFDGANQDCPIIEPDNEGCPEVPYYYENILWLPPYGEDNQVGGSTPMTIDPETGFLTAFPAALTNGQSRQFVVGVCVSEYRNGVFLGTTKRDFQFNVTECDIVSALPLAHAIQIGPGQFAAIECEGLTVTFNNTSIGADEYYWEFGDPTTTTDISTAEFPTYEYPDTGTYQVMLIANPSLSCNDTAILDISLYPEFTPNFDFDTNLCWDEGFSFLDQTITTYGYVDSWFWDFGDGITAGPNFNANANINNAERTTGTYSNPTHYYNKEGWYDVKLVTSNNLGCLDSVEYEVRVYRKPDADIVTNFLCVNTNAQFVADVDIAGAIVDWDWEIQTNNGTIDAQGDTVTQFYPTPGTFTASLIVESTLGCKDTTSLNFEVFPELQLDPSADTPICVNDGSQLLSNAIGGQNNGNSYEWSPANLVNSPTGRNTFTKPLTESQWFTVTATDPNGCMKTDSVFVDVKPLPEVDVNDVFEICFGEGIQINPIVDNTVVDYTWIQLPDSTIVSTFANPILSPTDTTTYIFVGTNSTGCNGIDTMQIDVVPPLDDIIVSDDATICEGDTITLEASGGLSFAWSSPNELLSPEAANQSNPTFTPSVSTTYTVTISNSDCFVETRDIAIDVLAAPYVEAGENTIIDIGLTTQLNGVGDVSYEWSPSETLDNPNIPAPVAMPLITTTYALTTFSPEGCPATDSVTVEVNNIFDILVPNAFSPNGDGLNDVFRVVRTRGIESFKEFSIYNRWGQQIFSGTDFNDGWDGTFNGILQETGVYVYIVRGEKFLGGIEENKGNVTLVR